MALGSDERIIGMPIDSLESGYTSSTFSKRIYAANQMTQPVLTMSGDTFSHMYQQAPTHIKIDVDGAEIDVLKGLTEVFKTTATLLIEVEDDLVEQFDAIMQEYILPSGLILCPIREPHSKRMKFFSQNKTDSL